MRLPRTVHSARSERIVQGICPKLPMGERANDIRRKTIYTQLQEVAPVKRRQTRTAVMNVPPVHELQQVLSYKSAIWAGGRFTATVLLSARYLPR